MVNYQEGLIYKIAHRYSPYVYIGSTTNFNRRKYQHKECCNNEKSPKYNIKLYQTIRECGGWDNFQMVLVAKCPCDDKKELHAKEFEYQQLFDANMNTINAVFDSKKYYQKHRVKLNERNKKNREINREKNNEYMKNYMKKYNQKNKKKLSEKIECECGCVVSGWYLKDHIKSPKHLKLMSC
jgi:hypothetical protein